ncbi:MAG: hypothetical protein IPN86_01105 [Saprospiraceae bacterium]|jgi:hypothetical protein|nr:hypothetical protein [Saprospiraceae bacterium]
MRLAFRLFLAILLLEIMGLYHCFGQDVRQVNYPSPTTIQSNEDQTKPSESSPIDLMEFLEVNIGDENSEDDTVHNFSSDSVVSVQFELIIDQLAKDQNAINRLLNFKEKRAPLFVLFHSWKYHIS